MFSVADCQVFCFYKILVNVGDSESLIVNEASQMLHVERAFWIKIFVLCADEKLFLQFRLLFGKRFRRFLFGGVSALKLKRITSFEKYLPSTICHQLFGETLAKYENHWVWRGRQEKLLYALLLKAVVPMISGWSKKCNRSHMIVKTFSTDQRNLVYKKKELTCNEWPAWKLNNSENNLVQRIWNHGTWNQNLILSNMSAHFEFCGRKWLAVETIRANLQFTAFYS